MCFETDFIVVNVIIDFMIVNNNTLTKDLDLAKKFDTWEEADNYINETLPPNKGWMFTTVEEYREEQ